MAPAVANFLNFLRHNWRTILLLLVLGIALDRFGFLHWPWSKEVPLMTAQVAVHDSATTVAQLPDAFAAPIAKHGVEQGIVGQILEKEGEVRPALVHTTTILHDTLFLPRSGIFFNRWLAYSVQLQNDSVNIFGANAGSNSVMHVQFPAPFWAHNRTLEIQSDDQGFRLFASEEKLLQWNGFHGAVFASAKRTFRADAWADLLIREKFHLGFYASTANEMEYGLRIAF
jgi:hypothetical protein